MAEPTWERVVELLEQSPAQVGVKQLVRERLADDPRLWPSFVAAAERRLEDRT